MDKANHIIHKVLLEVNTKSSEKAFFIKNNIDIFIRNELFPRIEKLFENYDVPSEIMRFEKLTLNINTNEWENSSAILSGLETQLAEKLSVKDLHSKIKDGPNNESNMQLPEPARNAVNVFLFFLKNGFLPWFGNKKQVVDFVESKNWMLALKNKSFLVKLKSYMKSDFKAAERFVFQVKFEQLIQFLEFNLPGFSENKTTWDQLLKSAEFSVRTECLKFLIYISCKTESNLWIPVYDYIREFLRSQKEFISVKKNNPESEAELFERLSASVLNEKQLQQLLLSEKQGKTENTEQDHFSKAETESTGGKINMPKMVEIIPFINEHETNTSAGNSKEQNAFFENTASEINVAYAGLILLHPFFKPFFEKIGVLNLQGEIKNEKKFLAVQALHFLASGTEDFFEGDLILEKYLSNVPLKTPIPAESILSESIKNETAVLLEEVIKKWPALKNTSPGGFRELFIFRDGKLVDKENRFKLLIERKAQDILLEKLLWNISLVKLPWKSEILFVEW